ncbi:MAG: IS21 family transposase [Bdellovibrionales bacterium]|nr:IS21 family transposase [Bdellovibrionales bacterium]
MVKVDRLGRFGSEVSRGVQLNVLAREHAGQTISYVQFWRQFRKTYPELPTVTMRLTHVPGEKCFFDYSEGIDIICRETGEVKSTSFMCGVMAMSSYAYGEFTFTQKREDLTRSMESAFRYFGGVTPYVTVDNQKAAVDRAHWYDPDVNPTFVDFANHWGFAVVPARPFRPRDKGANESAIGVVQRQFFQEVRERKFYSLSELNIAFREYLERLNGTLMKDWGVSRRERFDGERSLLKPCPSENWEQSEWRKAKSPSGLPYTGFKKRATQYHFNLWAAKFACASRQGSLRFSMKTSIHLPHIVVS